MANTVIPKDPNGDDEAKKKAAERQAKILLLLPKLEMAFEGQEYETILNTSIILLAYVIQSGFNSSPEALDKACDAFGAQLSWTIDTHPLGKNPAGNIFHGRKLQ